ncbi:hypothetical protein [Streptomyces sp. NPDC057877]|uniref:hypothetical protein n=1 Tax=Streptomyces sp. NPDC057877 TaxID=3346269 RepID=UPI0036CF6A58
MSDSTTSASELASQYAAQVSGDLERNVKEQERISAEIAALQEQLVTVQQDHSVLVSMQQALGITAEAAPAPTLTDETPKVPAPRKKTGGSSKRRAKAAKPSGRKAATASAESKQATLVDLVHGHLAEQSEPRSAAEITAALAEAHPERKLKTTVVRGTLETLVAKSQAQRSTQGRSVFYTAADGAQPQAGAPAAEESEPTR